MCALCPAAVALTVTFPAGWEGSTRPDLCSLRGVESWARPHPVRWDRKLVLKEAGFRVGRP